MPLIANGDTHVMNTTIKATAGLFSLLSYDIPPDKMCSVALERQTPSAPFSLHVQDPHTAGSQGPGTTAGPAAGRESQPLACWQQGEEMTCPCLPTHFSSSPLHLHSSSGLSCVSKSVTRTSLQWRRSGAGCEPCRRRMSSLSQLILHS